MSFAVALLFLSGALAAPRRDMLEVTSEVGADSTLTCTAAFQPGVPYLALRWYKVGDPPESHLSGLLTRDLPDGITQWYRGVERRVVLLGQSPDIFLSNLTCQDSGVYVCHLAAPVGQQNQNGRVQLSLTGCPGDSVVEAAATDSRQVILASVVLIAALLLFLLSYATLKTLLRDRHRTAKQEILLDAPLRPLEKKDLLLISMLGPKPSKSLLMKHVCV
ncbi:uncharacterized protein ACBR49_004677 [Aulostomus maculatus]